MRGRAIAVAVPCVVGGERPDAVKRDEVVAKKSGAGGGELHEGGKPGR